MLWKIATQISGEPWKKAHRHGSAASIGCLPVHDKIKQKQSKTLVHSFSWPISPFCHVKMGISGRISGSGLPSCGCILQEKICGDYWEGSQLLWCFCNYDSCFVGSFLSSCFLFTGLHNCAWPARPVSSSFELLQMLQLACTVKASAASANLVLAESIFGLYQKLSSNTMSVMRIMQYEYYCTMFQTFFLKKNILAMLPVVWLQFFFSDTIMEMRKIMFSSAHC